VIFLDADLIVQGDIAELYALAELNQDLLAAVASGSWRTYGGVHRDSLHLRGLDLDQPVFNAGVYVTDLGRWPEQGVQEKLEGWIAIHRQSLRDFAFGTQSIMNLEFYGKFQRLPAEWNVRPLGNHATIPQETLRAAKILHWAGKRKPWTADGLYKEYWIDYAFDIESSADRGRAQP
jgi:lipopolysaccharide biosynthesis glycosyltransferase